ncbi:hypothetical protein T05_7620 [Trichinella murrelli]|uniref:Uncharacterized protein n=1 Tax=Trichinella murrelli TaxID=144512 RepID=A0A0V0TNT2_9BILA|nr:hypothetical protein T05_7620 [Trichinella murrelli]
MTLRFFLIIVRSRSAVNFCYERRHFPLHNGSILVAHPLPQWPTSITQKQKLFSITQHFIFVLHGVDYSAMGCFLQRISFP